MSYFIEGKGAVMFPSGSESDKATEFTHSPTDGMTRFNTDSNRLETFHSDHGWVNLSIDPNSPTDLEIASGTVLFGNYFNPTIDGGTPASDPYDGYTLTSLDINRYSKIRIVAESSDGSNVVAKEYSITHDGVGGSESFPTVLVLDDNSIGTTLLEWNEPALPTPVGNELFTMEDVNSVRSNYLYLKMQNLTSDSETIKVTILGIVYEKDNFTDPNVVKGFVPANGTVRVGTKRFSEDKSFKFFVGCSDDHSNSHSIEVSGITNGTLHSESVVNDLYIGSQLFDPNVSVQVDGNYVGLYVTNVTTDPIYYVTKIL